MPRIREEFLNTLRDRLDIEEFISGYVNLKHQGRTSKGLCPFHSEKTPSFTVYNDTQSFYCYGCGKGGDIITFARDIENLDYIEAVKLLADKAGLTMPDDNYDDTMAKKRRRMYEINKEAARFYHACLWNEQGAVALDYWQNKRGLSVHTIRHFGLGFAPDDWHALENHMRSKGYSSQELYEANLIRRSEKNGKTFTYDNFRNRAMVPIIDLRGNIIAFGGRVLDDSKPKYVNTSDTLVYNKRNALFALNYAKDTGDDTLILCEGYLDVITLHQAGFNNAVAGLGTALTDEQVRLLARYANTILLSYDNDEAGKEATERALQKFDATGMSVRPLTLSGGKDPDEIIKKFGASRFQSIIDGAANETEYRLNEKRAKYDTSTDDGKVKYTREACEIIARISSPVEQDVYMSRLATELGISKDAVKLQVADSYKRLKRREQKVDFGQLNKALGNSSKVTRAEETILSLLLKNPDYLKRMAGKLSEEDFITPFYATLFKVLSHRIANAEPIDLMYLSGEFSPEDMGRIAKLQSAGPLVSNKYEEVEDCIKVLKESGNNTAVNPSDMTDDDFRNLFKKNN